MMRMEETSSLLKDELEDLLHNLMMEDVGQDKIESARAPMHVIEMFTALCDDVFKQDDEVKYLAVRIYEEFLPPFIRNIKDSFLRTQKSSSNEMITWEDYLEHNKIQQPLRVMTCILIASKAICSKDTQLNNKKIWTTWSSRAGAGVEYGVEGINRSEIRILELLSWKLPFNRSFDVYVACLYELIRYEFPVQEDKDIRDLLPRVQAISFMMRDELPFPKSQLTQAAGVIIASTMFALDFHSITNAFIQKMAEYFETNTRGFMLKDDILHATFALVDKMYSKRDPFIGAQRVQPRTSHPIDEEEDYN